MRYWKIARSLMACLLFLNAGVLFAQDAASGNVEMADGLRSNGKIYVVVASIAIIFIAVVIYLVMLDRKVKRLEKMLKNKN